MNAPNEQDPAPERAAQPEPAPVEPKKRGRKKAAKAEPAATAESAPAPEPAATPEQAAADPTITNEPDDTVERAATADAANPKTGADGDGDLPSIPDENVEKFLAESGVTSEGEGNEEGGEDEEEKPESERPDDHAADLVGARDNNDGPGWYLCLHGCIGAREYKARQRYYLQKNPAKTHFVKVPEEKHE